MHRFLLLAVLYQAVSCMVFLKPEENYMPHASTEVHKAVPILNVPNKPIAMLEQPDHTVNKRFGTYAFSLTHYGRRPTGTPVYRQLTNSKNTLLGLPSAGPDSAGSKPDDMGPDDVQSALNERFQSMNGHRSRGRSSRARPLTNYNAADSAQNGQTNQAGSSGDRISCAGFHASRRNCVVYTTP